MELFVADEVGKTFGTFVEVDDTGAGEPPPLPPAQRLDESGIG